MAHIFRLTIDNSYETASNVVSFLTDSKMLVNSRQVSSDPATRTITVDLFTTNKDKFERWLRAYDKNRSEYDPNYLVQNWCYKGRELGDVGKGEKLIRKAREIKYRKSQKDSS